MKLVFFLLFYMDPKDGLHIDLRNQNLVLSIGSLRFILGKTWEDKITNEDVLESLTLVLYLPH